jgi:hypothetical protein
MKNKMSSSSYNLCPRHRRGNSDPVVPSGLGRPSTPGSDNKGNELGSKPESSYPQDLSVDTNSSLPDRWEGTGSASAGRASGVSIDNGTTVPTPAGRGNAESAGLAEPLSESSDAADDSGGREFKHSTGAAGPVEPNLIFGQTIESGTGIGRDDENINSQVRGNLNSLNTGQDLAIELAMASLTKGQRELIKDCQRNVRIVDDDEDSRGDCPSQNEGKGIDPQNWEIRVSMRLTRVSNCNIKF